VINRAETLQQLASLCRARPTSASAVEATGWAQLDAVLPGGGWQSGTVVEVMPNVIGIGELRLLMPTLARTTRAGRHVALVAPPYIPFAPGLSQHGIDLERLLVIQAREPEDILWACEQALRCASFGAVVAWPIKIRDRETRRLQLAAEAGGSIGFVYRPVQAALEASPAAMRLKLSRQPGGALEVEVLKCRGGRSGMIVQVAAGGTPSQDEGCVAALPAAFESAR
jgi:hypothetical protein